MKRLTKAERCALSKIGGAGGRAASAKLTAEERRARAKAAGIASGKARKIKADKCGFNHS